MTTLAELKGQIIRLLQDEIAVDDYTRIGGETFGFELLEDAIHAALDVIASRVWKTDVFVIDEAVIEYTDLPEDLVQIMHIFDLEHKKFIPYRVFSPTAPNVVGTFGNTWTDVPTGTITFQSTLSSSGAKVYYKASWAMPLDEDGIIDDTGNMDMPVNATLAVTLYACSYCLLQEGTGIAKIRNYNTKVDSGSPIDNPSNEMANYFLKRYEAEMNRLFPVKTVDR